MAARSRVMASSCWVNSGVTAAAACAGFWVIDPDCGSTSCADIRPPGVERFCLATISTPGSDLVVKTDSSESSDDAQLSIILLASSLWDCQADHVNGAQVLTILFASSPWDSQAELAATPIIAAISPVMKKRATLRKFCLPLDELSVAV